jgi:hypothetical protein
MSCRKIKKNLVPFLDGELPSAEARRVRSHLQTCQACRKESELLQSSLDLALRRAREKTPPSPPEDFISLFWQRERSERPPAAQTGSASKEAYRGVRHTIPRPLPALIRGNRVLLAASALAVVTIALFAWLRYGRPPSPGKLSTPGRETQPPTLVANASLLDMEKRLEELEAAVRRLHAPSYSPISFTRQEMREIYAAIGLAAADSYRDILDMGSLAADRYSRVALAFPETSAGREAQKAVPRLN